MTDVPENRLRFSRIRGGFTLVELLVVIGIIAILMSLMLPAVNGAREVARRMQCSNNIRQLGLAVLEYESANKRLPPAGLVDINPDPAYHFGTFDPRAGKMISWVVLVLPFVEEGVLYDQFDLKRSILDQPNEPQQHYLDTLACPSDVARGRIYHDAAFTLGKSFAKGNYAAFVSPYHVDLQYVLPGALGGNGQRMRHIHDGASNTVMLSEVLTRDDPLDQRGAWALPWNASSLLAYDSHYIDTFRGMQNALRDHPSRRLIFQLEPCYLETDSCIQSMQTPNKRTGNQDILYSCKNPEQSQLDGMPCGEWTERHTVMHYLSAAPRSNHRGGVNIVSMDGHVRFLSDEVDPIAMAYLVSVHDSPHDGWRPEDE